jgi:mannose-6-phosphate isomerase
VIRELSNVVQAYAWGSHTALAELRGAPTPSAEPEAELWMGAHPLAPSRLTGTGEELGTTLSTAPLVHLGRHVHAAYGDKLPFLLKLLAAGTPLSLQAHPSIAQARAGFAADEALGIPLDAPHRNYKDRNHKPELICALGEFWALCGFREVPTTLELLAELELPELSPYAALLQENPNEVGIRGAFGALLSLDATSARQLAVAVSEAANRVGPRSSRFGFELAWATRLSELYPGDIGIVSALLLNLLRLRADEAIYLPAGNLHAYLGGTGVEIMASSDNVLRGGLTPKHINVPELLRVLDFRPLHVEPLRPVPGEAEGEQTFPTPAREFQLSFFDLGPSAAPTDVSVDGPEIWLVTRGSVELRSSSAPPVSLGPTRSAFVSAATGSLSLSGSGRVFRARVAS